MLPQSGEPPRPRPSSSDDHGNQEKNKPDWTRHVDAELAFRLVDSILPFEACLYHQILPLSLEGSRLKLGMVNMDDTAALDYVRRILAYMNCSLVPQPIASDVHYAALSAYLNYADKQKKIANPNPQPVARRIAKKLAEHSAKRPPEPPPMPDAGTNPTFVVDSPTELPPTPARDRAARLPEDATHIVDLTGMHGAEFGEMAAPLPAAPPSPAAESLSLPVLAIAPQHLTAPPEVLMSLLPPQLLTELLGRILTWGIGRLYLARQQRFGRILWSQNGVVQAVLEECSLSLLEAVLIELKHLVHCAIAPVTKPRQFELARLYQGEQILLRVRFMPGAHGEEATVQVLRGAALRFYQQQQLVALGQDVLTMAQQLQTKVIELYTQSHTHHVSLPDRLGIVPDLEKTLKLIHYQLNEVKLLHFDEPADNDR